MSNSYLKELEALKERLASLSDDDILALFEAGAVSPDEAAQFATLEQYVMGSVYAGPSLQRDCLEFSVIKNDLVLAA